jgi:hypothetical protein
LISCFATIMTTFLPSQWRFVKRQFLPYMLYCATLAALVFSHAIPKEHATTVLGVLGATFGVLMYAAPLAVMVSAPSSSCSNIPQCQAPLTDP